MRKFRIESPTRRDIVRGIGAAGLGAAASAPLARHAFAQTKKPVNISFWTFDNPQQRPWVHKRVKMFMEQNPHVKVDFQWFAFGDLGKKISVGFATGTAPDGFVSQDWFMPVWLDKGLLAPLDVKQLGYDSYGAFTGDFAKAFVDGATKDGKVYGYPMWFYGYCNYLNAKQFKEVGLDAEKDWPQNWEQLGEVAKRMTDQGRRQVRASGVQVRDARGAVDHDPVQSDPACNRAESGSTRRGKCTVNNEAGVRAMTIRASIAQKYGAEDPADSIATNPIPGMDFLKERIVNVLLPSVADQPRQGGKSGDGSRAIISGPCNIRAFKRVRAIRPPTASTSSSTPRPPPRSRRRFMISTSS